MPAMPRDERKSGKSGLPKAAPVAKAAPRPERQVAFQLGISAESRAAALLIAKGFRILARRWKSPAGEIDIIARRRQLLVFVEVKARANLDEAAESVVPRQRARIAAAAEAWLAVHGAHGFRDMRFDAILVAPGKLPRHIAGAFET
jgi:putative endonuclease